MAALKDLFKNPTAAELQLTERFAGLPENPQRTRNFEAFAKTGLPHRRVEAWKYSDLRKALKELPTELSADAPASAFAGLEGVSEIHLTDGQVKLPKGMKLVSDENVSALGGAEDIPVAALSAALASNRQALLIEVMESPGAPLHIVFDAKTASAFERISFRIREGVSLDVFETHTRAGGFSNVVIEYSLEKGAALSRHMYQAANVDAVQLICAIVHLEAEAKLEQSCLGFGAKLCRNETRVFHRGEGASANMNAAYLVGDGFHNDLTSLVRHSKGGCDTEQLVKGAIMDGGRAVFQGKFYVAKNAQKTAAEMSHNALILENGGEVNAKPELEIYADDVECAHGNTVGALDEGALFYIRQRGVPAKEARALLTEAFIAEALEAVPEAQREIMKDEARSWLTARL